MDRTLVLTVAEELLRLPLTEADLAALENTLPGLVKLVEAVETVPLPYLDDPFASPALADQWLASWPAEEASR